MESPFKKSGFWWFLVDENDGAYLFRQESKEEGGEVLGFVACRKRFREDQYVLGKVLKGGFKPVFRDRDFGYHAWQFQRDEEERATAKYREIK